MLQSTVVFLPVLVLHFEAVQTININIKESRRAGGCGPRLRQNKLEYCTGTVIIPSERVGGAFRELDRRSEDSISADRFAVYSIIKLIGARSLSAWGVRIADGRNRQQCMMRRLNASKSAEHPPDKGKNKSIETFGWDHRLRRQIFWCHSIGGSRQQCTKTNLNACSPVAPIAQR